MRSGKENQWLRTVTAASIAVTVLVGFVGFLHTGAGRKLMSVAGIRCPIDFSHLSAESVEKSRQMGVQALSGSQIAPARPALAGLTLDATTEKDAEIWASEHKMNCEVQVRGMHFLKCKDVLPEAPGRTRIQMLTLAFNPSEKLVAVDVFRRQLPSEEAALVMKKISADLRQSLGKPTEAVGELTARHLGGNSMKISFVNYRFKNYLAMLTATNIPWSGGVALHEQYSSVGSALH